MIDHTADVVLSLLVNHIELLRFPLNRTYEAYFLFGITILAITTLISGIVTKPTPGSINTLRKCLCFLIPVTVTFVVCPYFLNSNSVRATISTPSEHLLRLGVVTLITSCLMLILPRKNLKRQKVILVIYHIAILIKLLVILSMPAVA